MDRLGTFALALSLALAVYGASAASSARARDRPLLVESARTAAYSLFALLVAANIVMLVALLANDFAHPLRRGELEPRDAGVLQGAGAVVGRRGVAAAVEPDPVGLHRRGRVPVPAAPARDAARGRWRCMYGVQAFYLVLVLGPTRPFAALAVAPADGRGPLPLLQNHPLMAVHPPFLYLGFIGFTVPFAFGDGGAARRAGCPTQWISIDPPVDAGRSGCFLTIGLLLGALWSYGVLGWGGYWAWDPVENVALLPWLMATAFLHSVDAAGAPGHVQGLEPRRWSSGRSP